MQYNWSSLFFCQQILQWFIPISIRMIPVYNLFDWVSELIKTILSMKSMKSIYSTNWNFNGIDPFDIIEHLKSFTFWRKLNWYRFENSNNKIDRKRVVFVSQFHTNNWLTKISNWYDDTTYSEYKSTILFSDPFA